MADRHRAAAGTGKTALTVAMASDSPRVIRDLTTKIRVMSGLAHVPADLYRRPHHVAFGLQAWLSDSAPICPSGWSVATERWVPHRVFAMDCLRHLYAWRTRWESRPGHKHHRWTRGELIERAMSYWLVAGPDAIRR